MLVLTRKHQEKIRIGDNIVITVLKMKGKAVRLGIEAPVEVPVIRGELTFEGRTTPGSRRRTAAAAAATFRCRNSGRRVCEFTNWPRCRSMACPAGAGQPATCSPQASKSILPRLASDSSPLRAMLDRRSLTT